MELDRSVNGLRMVSGSNSHHSQIFDTLDPLTVLKCKLRGYSHAPRAPSPRSFYNHVHSMWRAHRQHPSAHGISDLTTAFIVPKPIRSKFRGIGGLTSVLYRRFIVWHNSMPHSFSANRCKWSHGLSMSVYYATSNAGSCR